MYNCRVGEMSGQDSIGAALGRVIVYAIILAVILGVVHWFSLRDWI